MKLAKDLIQLKGSRSSMVFGSTVLLSTLALFIASGCSSPSTESNSGGKTNDTGTKMTITGAGSTFVNPAMSKWIYSYKDATINYQSVGSGAGIAQYKAGTVDFGATDAPLSDKEVGEMPQPTVHVPVIAGCLVLAYNLEGVEDGLKLSPAAIAGIFSGKVTKWNDPVIVKDNPGVKLGDTPITVAHRSDGSGTTYVFTDYLSAVSPEWKASTGMGKTVNWPTGIGGKGNEGVSGLIKQTPGSIGYVELAYAVQTKLHYGPVQNKAGKFVTPSLESTTAAANSAAEAMKTDIRVSIVNSSGDDAYPICGFTYVLVPKAAKDAAKGKALYDFLNWVFGPGQEMAAPLQYAPLPASVVELNKQAIAGLAAAK